MKIGRWAGAAINKTVCRRRIRRFLSGSLQRFHFKNFNLRPAVGLLEFDRYSSADCGGFSVST